MESKTKVKNSIELFYIKTKSKSDTYNKFKDFKINGSPAYSKRGIYKIFTRIDECGHENVPKFEAKNQKS